MALPLKAVPPTQHRPAVAKKIAHPAVPLTEVEIFTTPSHTLVGFPDALPLKRAASNDLDNARVKTIRDLLAASSGAAKALKEYTVAHGHAEAGTDKADLAVILAQMWKSGLMIARGASFKGVTASPLTLSAAGQQFLYDHETLPGVSEKLHHPSAASGVTLGPGYDMLTKSALRIQSDLVSIGVDTKVALTIAGAAGLAGVKAESFVAAHAGVVTLTSAQQVALLKKVISPFVAATKAGLAISVAPRLFEYEFDALVSFTYNLGHLRGTHLASRINSGNLESVSFSRRGPSQARVHAEWLMFTSGIYL